MGECPKRGGKGGAVLMMGWSGPRSDRAGWLAGSVWRDRVLRWVLRGRRPWRKGSSARCVAVTWPLRVALGRRRCGRRRGSVGGVALRDLVMSGLVLRCRSCRRFRRRSRRLLRARRLETAQMEAARRGRGGKRRGGGCSRRRKWIGGSAWRVRGMQGRVGSVRRSRVRMGGFAGSMGIIAAVRLGWGR